MLQIKYVDSKTLSVTEGPCLGVCRVKGAPVMKEILERYCFLFQHNTMYEVITSKDELSVIICLQTELTFQTVICVSWKAGKTRAVLNDFHLKCFMLFSILLVTSR